MIEKVLKDLVEKPISGEWGTDGGDIKVLRTTNFTNEGIIDYSNVVLRNIDERKVNSKKLKPGDIIIEKSGGSPKQPVGRVVYFDNEGTYLCNNFTSVLRPKGDRVFSKYLLYILFSNHQFGFTGNFQNKTTGIINLQLTRYINKTKIPLPPLATQKKIAAILDEADKLRQLDKKLIEKYEALTQSLFLDMFGDPVTNKKDWETKSIVELVKDEKYSLKRGPFGGALKKEIFVEDGYLVYEQFHALNNDFSMARYFIDEKKYNELIGFAVKPKDIIISCSGVYLGKLAIVPGGAKEGIINQALLKVTLDESKMRNDFFVFHFTQDSFRRTFFDANRGAGIPNFPPMKDFKKFPFILPPINLQNQFSERVQAIEAQKAQAQQSLQKSEELFNSLLQKAFKGELV
ncbi:restriction endonuclease subunit S [Formosa maritima]|uniref:Restriction endonuclease subunit S n=1 Tax=Formosa maritima TaxID=2592046 RepID=A0A5D0GA19_9FLAO|nr:restriction endonuclease subunit S [Formosa maritima]TYA55704.1 restriction endonuclease subunit S [Formosa maritima]